MKVKEEKWVFLQSELHVLIDIPYLKSKKWFLKIFHEIFLTGFDDIFLFREIENSLDFENKYMF